MSLKDTSLQDIRIQILPQSCLLVSWGKKPLHFDLDLDHVKSI